MNRLHRRADKVQDHFEVVDHQVEHDADLGAAWVQAFALRRIGREPVRLDEARRLLEAIKKAKHWIEAFDVADLQNQFFLVRQLDELLGLGGGRGDGFLHQQMQAVLEQQAGDLAVTVGGHDDARGLALADETFQGWENGDAVFLGDARGAGGVHVIDAHQLRLGQFGIDPRVMLAERADADDPDLDSMVDAAGVGGWLESFE